MGVFLHAPWGGCEVIEVVFYATTIRLDNNCKETYTGLTGGSFKSQFNRQSQFDMCKGDRVFLSGGWGDYYLDSMGCNRTSTLYTNSSGPRISTIRPTAAWSTPDVSLNPGFLEFDEVFLEVSLPVDDVVSGTRTLHC